MNLLASHFSCYRTTVAAICVLLISSIGVQGQTSGAPKGHPNYKVDELTAQDAINSNRTSTTTLRMADIGEGRSANVKARTSGDKPKTEPKTQPKWSDWETDKDFEGKENAKWKDALSQSPSELFTVTATADAGSDSVDIELFDAKILNETIVKIDAVGAALVPGWLKDELPEIVSNWDGGADFTEHWVYVDFHANGSKIGKRALYNFKDAHFGYTETEISGPKVVLPQFATTIDSKLSFAEMKAAFTGVVELDESKADPWVRAHGKVTGESIVRVEFTSTTAGVIELNGGGQGAVTISGGAALKGGKFRLTSFGFKIDEITTDVTGTIKTPIGNKVFFQEKWEWPGEVDYNKEWPDPDVPVILDRSKM